MLVFDSIMDDVKQVIVVRTDLKMGKGKIAAQVGHACILGAEHAKSSNPEWHARWWEPEHGGSQAKVVLKVSSLKNLQDVKIRAIDLKLPWAEVADAGHTQIAPGTITCVSIGPAPESLIDKITGDLKLL